MDDTALPTLAAGTLLAERYRVLGHLGTGGMGAVYRVEHVMMAKQLARKTAKKVELVSLNPDFPPRDLDMDQIAWMARIVWASQ